MTYNPTTWRSGDKVTSTKLNKIEQGIQGNDIELADVTEKVNQLKSEFNNIEDRIDVIKDKYWYADAIDSTNIGFVFTDGSINTTNTNYKYIKYTPKNEAIKIKVDSLYINGSGSSYAVFAFYKEDNTFIKAISNTDINTETSQSLFENVEATIPKGTAYILITFGNMSSSTNFSTITEYGIYVPETKLKLFNIPVSGDWAQQFYFHIATLELGDYTSLYFNAKFETSEPVLKYDIFFTGYEENYSGRAFTVYHTNLTKGINGNEVTISENFQNTANSIKAKYWTGVIVNLYYAQPTAGAGNIRLLNKYSIISKYCTLNGQQIELVQYPDSSYRVIDNEYKEPYNPLQGGYLCVIGDSLSATYYKTEQETWVYLISKWNSMRYDNFAISENPVAKTSEYTENKCMAERVDDLVARNYTHIMLMGGANDFNFSIPIGENSDTEITTFKGALNHIIDTLITKFPQAKIVFATTYRRNINYLDRPYADAMIEICKLHSIPCLNNYDSSGVHFFNSAWMSYFGATNALGNNHLNAAGDLYVAPRFEQFLKYPIS